MSSALASTDSTDNAVVPKATEVAAKPKNWVKFEEDPPEAKIVAPEKNSHVADDAQQSKTIKPESVAVSVDKIAKAVETNDARNKETNEYSGAVIATESVQINLDRSGLNRSISSESPEINVPSDVRVSDPKSASLKTIDLRDNSNGRNNVSNVISTPIGNIRQGFANGDTIVTLLPVNTRWPWITPAKFRPELVPEELMAQGLTVSPIYLARIFGSPFIRMLEIAQCGSMKFWLGFCGVCRSKRKSTLRVFHDFLN